MAVDVEIRWSKRTGNAIVLRLAVELAKIITDNSPICSSTRYHRVTQPLSLSNQFRFVERHNLANTSTVDYGNKMTN